MELDQELKQAFLKEAQDNINTCNDGLKLLNEQQTGEEKRKEIIRQIFVAFHTLTTNAGMVKMGELSELANDLKEIFRSIHHNKLALSKNLLLLLIKAGSTSQSLLNGQIIQDYDNLRQLLKNEKEVNGVKNK